jgi:hypothetical protein
VRNLRASVTWMEAARLTAVERMPAVSQVSTLPVGGLGKMQARQAVGGSCRFEVRLRFAQGAGCCGEDVHGGGVGADGGGVDPGDGLLDGEVVDEVAGLEVVGGVEDDVGGMRWPGGVEQLGDVGGDEVGDAGVDGDVGVEAGDVAAGGLGLWAGSSRASASSKRTWRWRLEGSTKSRSMRVRVPTPARASSDAEAAPMAPQPTMATCALRRGAAGRRGRCRGRGSGGSSGRDRRAAKAGLSRWKGLRVEKIEFEGVVFDAKDPLPQQLPQQAGEPLDPAKVAASIRRLFASGRYRDIRVEGEREGDGVTLIFAGTPRYFVGRVTIAME